MRISTIEYCAEFCVQDTLVYQASDPQVLEWAATENRILLTHDIETMIGFAMARVHSGLPMTGIIVIRDSIPIGQVIDDIIVIIEASEMSDWKNQIIFLPL